MTPGKERLLFATFPHVFALRLKAYSPLNNGLCCGDGWYDIIHDFSTSLEEELKALKQKSDDGPVIGVVEVKEREGVLSMRMEPSALITQSMTAAIKKAVKRSKITCEICGESGKSRMHKGMRQTLCKKGHR